MPGENFFEIQAAAKSYTKKYFSLSEILEVEKKELSQRNGLVAIPFDKGIGFFVMKKHTQEAKLTQVRDSGNLGRY